jgi:hypothetical protein
MEKAKSGLYHELAFFTTELTEEEPEGHGGLQILG